MEKLKHLLIEAKTGCPVATQDIHVNLKNRQHAIDEYYYGPANPDKPGSYWKDAAKRWKIDEITAKTMKCGNCAAFDISPRMLDCMPGEVEDAEGRLGYCWMHHFKCHSARTCYTWAAGGPITTDETSRSWANKAKP